MFMYSKYPQFLCHTTPFTFTIMYNVDVRVRIW